MVQVGLDHMTWEIHELFLFQGSPHCCWKMAIKGETFNTSMVVFQERSLDFFFHRLPKFCDPRKMDDCKMGGPLLVVMNGVTTPHEWP